MENITNKTPDVIENKNEREKNLVSSKENLCNVLSIKPKECMKYIIGIEKYQPLSKNEQDELFELYNTTGNKEAYDKIILSNLGYVILYCKRFLSGLKEHYNCDRLNLYDLILAGYGGLIKAVESRKFHPGKGSFLSFANYYIKGNLIDYLHGDMYGFGSQKTLHGQSISITLRPPKGNLRKIRAYIDEFYQSNGRLPRDVEIIEFYRDEDMGDYYAAKDFLRYYQLLQEGILSLDKIQNDITMYENENDVTMSVSEKGDINSEFMVDEDKNADKKVNQESLRTDIFRALSTLTDREAKILKMFFGIGYPEYNLAEIGDIFGLTEERTRQIKEKAIRRLKSLSRSKILIKYL